MDSAHLAVLKHSNRNQLTRGTAIEHFSAMYIVGQSHLTGTGLPCLAHAQQWQYSHSTDRTYASTGTYGALLHSAVYVHCIHIHAWLTYRPGLVYSSLPCAYTPFSCCIDFEPVCVYTYIIYVECIILALIESHTTWHDNTQRQLAYVFICIYIQTMSTR